MRLGSDVMAESSRRFEWKRSLLDYSLPAAAEIGDHHSRQTTAKIQVNMALLANTSHLSRRIQDMAKRKSTATRREFLSATAVGAAAALAGPLVLTARGDDAKLIVGEGEYKYEVNHDWPQLPDKFTWQTTHNVAVDKSG